MPNQPALVPPARTPPTKHQLALMIWIAVFPTLTALNLTLGPHLQDLSVVLRTLVLATLAVPIVIYGVMPRLHVVRGWLLNRSTAGQRTRRTGRKATAPSTAQAPATE